MPTTDHPSLRLRGAADLLDTVPYLLGFRPHDSLVLVGLDHHSVVVTARIDLDDVIDDPGLVHDTAAAMRRGGASRTIVIAYHHGANANEAKTALETSAVAATGARLDLVDCIEVTGRRWRSVRCDDPTCCPPDGRELAEQPTVIDVAATVSGLHAEPNRQALTDRLSESRDGAALAPLLHAAEAAARKAEQQDQLEQYRSLTIDALRGAAALADAGRRLPEPADTARLAVALRDVTVRDAAWLDIEKGHITTEALWRHLARACPAPYTAAPLFLCAWHAWRSGDGATANIAVQQALRADPDYSAATLLAAVLAAGVNPNHVPRFHRLAAAPHQAR